MAWLISGCSIASAHPFFHSINSDTVTKCVESCHSVDNTSKYEPFLAGEHLMAKHNVTRSARRASVVRC